MMFEIDDLAEHLDDLYRFAFAISRDANLAGDLVHDAIVRAIEKREQYRSDAPLGAWLRRILVLLPGVAMMSLPAYPVGPPW